jgi:hypothetical protein
MDLTRHGTGQSRSRSRQGRGALDAPLREPSLPSGAVASIVPVRASTQEEGATSARVARPDHRSSLSMVSTDEIAGWCGAAALLLAFGLGATGAIRPSSAVYLVLNLFGAVGLAYTSLARRAYPPAVLNVIWAVIAAVSLVVLLANI